MEGRETQLETILAGWLCGLKWLRGPKMKNWALKSKSKGESKSYSVQEKWIRPHLFKLSTKREHRSTFIWWHKGAGGCRVGKESSYFQWQSLFLKSGCEKGTFLPPWIKCLISFTFYYIFGVSAFTFLPSCLRFSPPLSTLHPMANITHLLT